MIMKLRKRGFVALVFITLIGAVLFNAARGQTQVFEAYEQLDYDEMREKLDTLATHFPEVMLLENSDTKLGVPYLVHCDDKKETLCVLDIVTVTDFKTSSEEKVQVFVAGSLLGEEKLGAQIVYYLIEYLVSNFHRDVAITYLLQTREIVFMPMPNAYGYAKSIRKELVPVLGSSGKKYKDP